MSVIKPGDLSPPDEFHPQLHSVKMRPTQVAAFQQIEANGLLSKLRFDVYKAIYDNQEPRIGITSGELDRLLTGKLGAWTRSASPRLIELVRLDVIEELPTRKCRATGQTVLAYQTTGRLPNPDGLKERTVKLTKGKAKRWLEGLLTLIEAAEAVGVKVPVEVDELCDFLAVRAEEVDE